MIKLKTALLLILGSSSLAAEEVTFVKGASTTCSLFELRQPTTSHDKQRFIFGVSREEMARYKSGEDPGLVYLSDAASGRISTTAQSTLTLNIDSNSQVGTRKVRGGYENRSGVRVFYSYGETGAHPVGGVPSHESVQGRISKTYWHNELPMQINYAKTGSVAGGRRFFFIPFFQDKLEDISFSYDNDQNKIELIYTLELNCY